MSQRVTQITFGVMTIIMSVIVVLCLQHSHDTVLTDTEGRAYECDSIWYEDEFLYCVQDDERLGFPLYQVERIGPKH